MRVLFYGLLALAWAGGDSGRGVQIRAGIVRHRQLAENSETGRKGEGGLTDGLLQEIRDDGDGVRLPGVQGLPSARSGLGGRHAGGDNYSKQKY